MIERASVKRSPADWALQWLWDQPEVSVVFSGMSNMDQVEANLDSAAHARSHSFQAADLKLIAELQQKYRERAAIPCTKCNYCMPCPNGVDIPANFEIYNDAFLHEDIPARASSMRFLSRKRRGPRLRRLPRLRRSLSAENPDQRMDAQGSRAAGRGVKGSFTAIDTGQPAGCGGGRF